MLASPSSDIALQQSGTLDDMDIVGYLSHNRP
jgi:hypothetical protein